jgi:hypothetical protein
MLLELCFSFSLINRASPIFRAFSVTRPILGTKNVSFGSFRSGRGHKMLVKAVHQCLVRVTVVFVRWSKDLFIFLLLLSFLVLLLKIMNRSMDFSRKKHAHITGKNISPLEES